MFTAAYVAATDVPHVAVLPDGTRIDISPAEHTQELTDVPEPELPIALVGLAAPLDPTREAVVFGCEIAAAPLGQLFGARSGDKGGAANVGVWARSDDAFVWLADYLDVEQFKRLLPETRRGTSCPRRRLVP